MYLPLTPCWKTKSRWIKDLNVKDKTLKFLVENMSKYQLDLGVGIDFLKQTSMTIKNKINTFDYIKIKNFIFIKRYL